MIKDLSTATAGIVGQTLAGTRYGFRDGASGGITPPIFRLLSYCIAANHLLQVGFTLH